MQSQPSTLGSALNGALPVHAGAASWNRTEHGLIVPASYAVDRRKCVRTGLSLPDVPQRYGDQTAIGLFVGAGGMSLGMAMAGFHEVAASEQDDAAAATYLYNLADRECEVHYLAPGDEARAKRAKFEPGANPHRPEWAAVEGCLHFYFGDCRQLTGQRVLADLGMVPTEIDVVHGGPPCQGLSTMNSKRCIEEPRNALLWEVCRLVEEIRPKCFLMENVPPLLSAARGDLFRCLCRRMNQAGYDVVANILDAVGYGVPQYRRRALVVGTLAEMGARAKFQFPIPSHWGIVAPAGGEFHHTPGFFEHYGMDGGDVEYDEEAGTFRGGDIGDTRPRVKSPQAALDLDGETA